MLRLVLPTSHVVGEQGNLQIAVILDKATGEFIVFY
jgi:hypothetical protein